MMCHRIRCVSGTCLRGFARLGVGLALLLTGCRATDGGTSSEAVQTESAYEIRAEAGRLDTDVRWLAADAREGRRSGMAGERAAGDWIAARFSKLGLETAGEGGFFQEFPVPLPVVDGGASSLSGTGQHGGELSFEGEDWVVPLFCSGSGRVSGPLLFVGYGIERPEMNWNDFEGLDLTGCVALLLRGTPPGPGQRPTEGGEDAMTVPADASTASSGEEGEEPTWGSTGSIFHKVMEAKRRGAVGVILVQHPDQADEPLLSFQQARSAQADIPAVMVSNRVLKHLLLDFEKRLSELERWGTPFYDPPPPGEAVVVHADVERFTGKARNVLARLAGRDSSRTVIIGAHYDHLGRGDMGSRAPGRLGEIHNGADDNASGTAVVLEVARILAQAGNPPPCDVVFALWSGEELGLVGSAHWAGAPTLPLDEVAFNVNLDMVGRVRSGSVQVLGAGSAPGFDELVRSAAGTVGLEVEISLSGQGMGGSDHQTFLSREIPALHLFTGIHDDYHKPSDDAGRFEASGAAQVTDLVLLVVEAIGGAEATTLAWSKPPASESANEERSERGFNTWFGSVPASYTDSGTGVLLAGTSAGSPAERAGLLPGDVLIGIGDVEIKTIHDLVFALQRYNPGNVVETRYLRNDKEESVRLTLLGRAIE